MDHLSGNMDGSKGLVCDTADEEVHFSRDHALAGYYKNHTPGSASQLAGGYQATIGEPLTDPGAYDPIQGSWQPSEPSVQRPPLSQAQQVDWARSNRLLQSIGSRLRRGSNYLVAPKLAGEYLLGITIRSWFEFFDSSRLAKMPINAHQLSKRLAQNLAYFQGNYLCVLLVLIIYCILTSPLLLLAILAYLVALYLVTARSAMGRPLQFGQFKPSLQQLYSFITLISLPLLWVAGAPSALFWVIGASFVVVGLHASFHCPIENLPMVANPSQAGQLACQARSLHQERRPTLVNGIDGRKQSISAYYNHYRLYPLDQMQDQLYLEVSPDRGTQGRDRNQGGGIHWSHWMGFGGARPCSRPAERRPQVTIISHNYAGLGRVHEV